MTSLLPGLCQIASWSAVLDSACVDGFFKARVCSSSLQLVVQHECTSTVGDHRIVYNTNEIAIMVGAYS